jgi:hypothetical protein
MYKRKNENIYPHENFSQIFIETSFINTKVELIQMSISRWTYKSYVVHPYDGVLLRREDKCYNMEKSWKRYVKWKKSVTKDHMLYDSIYMKCPE